MSNAERKLTYSGELVRKLDPDRFTMSLLMPPVQREALWALFAFNHEVAKTREVVTDTTLGLIRLQWWRDALAEVYDGKAPRQNEIMPDLAAAIVKHDLPREEFEQLLYAREFDLENVLPASLEGLESYAEFTCAPLLRLAAKVGGGEEHAQTLRDIAVGYGLVGLLRAVPFHAGQRRCYMPGDLMAENGVAERSLYDFKPEAAFKAVTAAVGERAGALLQAKPQSRIGKMHRRVAGLYLGQLRRLGYDVFSPRTGQPPAFFHLRILLKPL